MKPSKVKTVGKILLIVAMGLAGVALCVGAALLPSAIVWAVWNHGIAPAFNLPHLSFLLTFGILCVLTILGRTLKGGNK